MNNLKMALVFLVLVLAHSITCANGSSQLNSPIPPFSAKDSTKWINDVLQKMSSLAIASSESAYQYGIEALKLVPQNYIGVRSSLYASLAWQEALTNRPEAAIGHFSEFYSYVKANQLLSETGVDMHLNNYGSTLLSYGRPDDAVGILLEALRYGSEPGYFGSHWYILTNLALAYMAIGEKDEAFRYASQLKPIEKPQGGDQIAQCLLAIDIPAQVAYHGGDWRTALELYQKGLKELPNDLRNPHLEALYLARAAVCSLYQKDPIRAKQLFADAESKADRVTFSTKSYLNVAGIHSTSLRANILEAFADYDLATKDFKAADREIAKAKELKAILPGSFDDVVYNMEAHRLLALDPSEWKDSDICSYLEGVIDHGKSIGLVNSFDKLSISTAALNQILSKMESEQLTRNYDLILQAKYLLTRADQWSKIASVNPEFQALRFKVIKLQSQVDNIIAYRSTTSLSAEKREELQKKKAELDEESSRLWNQLRGVTGRKPLLEVPNLSSILKVLATKNASHVTYLLRTDRKSLYYAAVVLLPGRAPSYLELASKQTIKDSIRSLIVNLDVNEVATEKLKLTSLYSTLIAPLRGLIGNSRRLYIEPEDVVAQVPFAGLLNSNGKYLVEDFLISYLPAAGDMVVPAVPSNSMNAVLVGDVDYNADLITGHQDLQSLRPGLPNLTQIAGVGGLDEQGNWKLFQSNEIEQLSKIEPFNRPESKTLRGSKATESAVLNIRSPKYLHISTHGFYLEERKQPISSSQTMSTLSQERNVMYRSGLVLSGANRAAELRNAGRMDGWVTASEVSRMDLSQTRLVTLTSCETGLGDYLAGQGVLGLRRAFRKAGAQGVVMSLFEIPVVETGRLMTELYKALLNEQDPAIALRSAQLQQMKRSGNPKSWAGLIYEGK